MDRIVTFYGMWDSVKMGLHPVKKYRRAAPFCKGGQGDVAQVMHGPCQQLMIPHCGSLLGLNLLSLCLDFFKEAKKIVTTSDITGNKERRESFSSDVMSPYFKMEVTNLTEKACDHSE